MQTVWLAPLMQFRCSNREKYKILPRDDFESRNYSKCFSRGFGPFPPFPSLQRGPTRPVVLCSFLFLHQPLGGSSCFKPFANELSIKFYHASQIKENLTFPLIYTALLARDFSRSDFREENAPFTERVLAIILQLGIQSKGLSSMAVRFAFKGACI